ncbi:hypothetical protein OJF2_00710 [Aquisphaera giovannonii]|uniref:Uncharacterized protein n=1 Tax=Aquisphaera giovannonii TaxID=406548 RepID=A0A5B9VSY6_9BACT|nr:hypothetical protein [Aquisphaera giovannonii]QEH31606.1 hypothetical protein OJF2_00710 [Aquisphaera giovannonii]
MCTDGAAAGGVDFAPGNILGEGKCVPIAMSGDATRELWRFEAAGLEANGAAVANDVIDFKPSSDPNLFRGPGGIAARGLDRDGHDGRGRD